MASAHMAVATAVPAVTVLHLCCDHGATGLQSDLITATTQRVALTLARSLTIFAFFLIASSRNARRIILSQLGTASITLCGAIVETIFVSLNPAASNRAQNSALVRSHPPVITNMFRSRS